LSQVTGLAPDPRRPGCVVVEVDQGRFTSLPLERLTGAGLSLAEGATLTPREMALLQSLADAESAWLAARRSLALRAHAEADLRRKLTGKGHPPTAIADALARLSAQGLLDDSAFAQHYARTRVARGRGPSRLVHDLLRQGVERGLAERSVAQAVQDEGIDPQTAARALAEKRARELEDVPPKARFRRVVGYLARRGFTGVPVRDLVREVLEAPPAVGRG
jgi:regulatory protein